MPKDVNGHRFDFGNDVCQICGMTRTRYEDSGQPPCRGRDAEKPIPVPTDFGTGNPRG